MSKLQLSLSKSPALGVPLRFFITAPLFGIAVAAMVIWQGESAWASRWSPAMLALTHFMVLGYISMVMQGALLQVVSVVLGRQPPHVEVLGRWTHHSLALGSLLLGIGFIASAPALITGAAGLLGLSFMLFLGAMISSVLGRTNRTDSVVGISLALVSLGVTVLLGIGLAIGYAHESLGLAREFTDLHVAWGLMGWVLILVVTIAYVVVPMFQLTPAYPRPVTRGLAWTLMIGLLLSSGGRVSMPAPLVDLGGLLIVAAILIFAVTTLWLQGRRKKKQWDVTVGFWRLAMLALLASVVIGLAGRLYPAWAQNPAHPLLLGVFLIPGFAVSVINGMLYKIVPFLVWLHLSALVTQLKLSRRLTPNIKTMLSKPLANVQLGLQALSLALLVFSLVWTTTLLTPAAIAFAASNILLLINLTRVLGLYKNTEKTIRDTARESPPSGL